MQTWLPALRQISMRDYLQSRVAKGEGWGAFWLGGRRGGTECRQIQLLRPWGDVKAVQRDCIVFWLCLYVQNIRCRRQGQKGIISFAVFTYVKRWHSNRSRAVDVGAVQRTDCIARIGSIEWWQPAGHSRVALRTATEETDSTVGCMQQLVYYSMQHQIYDAQ